MYPKDSDVRHALGATLVDAAHRARRRVGRIDTTVTTPDGPLRIVYPATGDETG